MIPKETSQPVPGEFRCFNCGRYFPLGIEEEASAELQQNFGDIDMSGCEMFCDECYLAFMAGSARWHGE